MYFSKCEQTKIRWIICAKGFLSNAICQESGNVNITHSLSVPISNHFNLITNSQRSPPQSFFYLFLHCVQTLREWNSKNCAGLISPGLKGTRSPDLYDTGINKIFLWMLQVWQELTYTDSPQAPAQCSDITESV